MTHLKTCVIERKLLTKNFKNTIQASSTDAFLIQYLHPKKSTFKVPKFHSRANVDTLDYKQSVLCTYNEMISLCKVTRL